MKQAWTDLKSFVTISMVLLLFVIVIANLCGMQLDQTILLLVTNSITMVLTYYFTRPKKSTDENPENTENKGM